MAIDPDRCPDDLAETAEAYCMSGLAEEDAQAFEEHYLACPKCAAEVEHAQESTHAMQAAADQARREAPD
jgi:anti-sigma factor RsiW